MNSAVGENCPPWLCIESKAYAELFIKATSARNHTGDAKKAKPAKPKKGGVAISPTGERIRFTMATKVAKIIGKDAWYIRILLRKKGRHVFNDGWEIRRS
jgi:hypothetical protein